MLSYPGYILSIFGLVLFIFALVIPMIRAYTNDERGLAVAFAIFKNKPWIILAVIAIVIYVIGQFLAGKY